MVAQTCPLVDMGGTLPLTTKKLLLLLLLLLCPSAGAWLGSAASAGSGSIRYCYIVATPSWPAQPLHHVMPDGAHSFVIAHATG
jgi:hypothetical protein